MKYLIWFCLLAISLSSKAMEYRVVSLKEALKALDANNMELAQRRFDVAYSAKTEEIIKAKYSPNLDIMLGVGPINKAYGDALQSSDADIVNFKSWGVLAMATVEAKIPIYTWGQKGDFLKAARLGKKVKEAGLKKNRNKLHYELKKIYYGNLVAANLMDFIEGIEEDMNKALKELKKRKKDKDSLYQLKVFKNQVDIKKITVKQKYELSQRALAYFMGEGEDVLAKPSEEWLEFQKRRIKPFTYYKQLFFKYRPELHQLRNGIKAKSLLAQAQHKDKYPMLGILGKYDFSYTSAREKQESVFAYDPYNKNSLVVGVGFTWKLDWGLSEIKAQQIEVEKQQLEYKKVQAENGLLLELYKSWKELKDCELKVKKSGKARRYAKKWLNRVLMKSGLGGKLNIDKFAKAYQLRALTFKDYVDAVYDYYLAWAKLSQLVGTEVDPLLTGK